MRQLPINITDMTHAEAINLVLYPSLVDAFAKRKKNEEIMNNLEFPYGTVVIFKKHSPDEEGEIGIIVGCYEIDGLTYPYIKQDPGDVMYRVHFNNNREYEGVRARFLKKFEGETPEHLKDVKWNQIYYQGLVV